MKRIAPLAVLVCCACGGGLPGADSADNLSLQSKIKHLVVIVQENHSFDAYFGTWCQAPVGSEPSCTSGQGCCEAAPAQDPSGSDPVALTDRENGDYSPNHDQSCELPEMNGGAMDRYVTASCGDKRNFALAGDSDVPTYREWASQYAIADRYFQPVAGASSSNDMYLATARYMFLDNTYEPNSMGSGCSYNRDTIRYKSTTIHDLLTAKKVDSSWYIEGYQAMADAWVCGWGAPDCTSSDYFPCIYDPSDIPAAYFKSTADKPAFMRDYGQLATDLAAGTLPAVVFVKPLGFRSEHPGYGSGISEGVKFVSDTFAAIEGSQYASDTLVLVTWDESGGFFDHVTPPPDSTADGQPYGPRVPLLALGPFARQGSVSHVIMEHSSIVKFIEWNWLDGVGQLAARDAVVNNIGSLLDPAATGVVVPAN